MRIVKLNLLVVAISSALCLLLLLWNESATTCGETTCKMLETMFAIVSLWSLREYYKLIV